MVYGPWWDATLADFRRLYHLDMRTELDRMPGVDFHGLVLDLVHTRGSSLRRMVVGEEWGPHEENTARLYEAQAYRLELDWIERTTDPNDPEVKRQRALSEKNGIRPPARPIVPVVALRPERNTDLMLAEYLRQIQACAPQKDRDQVSLSEFDQAISRM